MLAKTWLENARDVMERIETTQMDNITRAAEIMAESIAVERWVHTFGCGHATLPVEEMYPRIGGFVGFHPMIELPLTYFTHITGEMGIHQFLFLERAEGFGREVMKSYDFDPRDTMWIFSHSGLNPVNIDVANEAKARGLKLVVTGSEAAGPQRGDALGQRGERCAARVDADGDACVAGLGEKRADVGEQGRRKIVDAVVAVVLKRLEHDALAGSRKTADEYELHGRWRFRCVVYCVVRTGGAPPWPLTRRRSGRVSAAPETR